MNDCAKNGDYCKFNERFLALLSNLETQEWFSKYEIPGEFEFIFNEEFGEFEKNPKMAQFYEVEYMREIVLGELRSIEQGRTESSTTIPSQLLDKLENVNFNEIYAYLLEPEEELLTGEELGRLIKKEMGLFSSTHYFVFSCNITNLNNQLNV